MGEKEAKQNLRREVLALRASLTPEQRAYRSVQAAERLLALSALSACQTIMVFHPFQDEIDTRIFLEEARKRGKELWLPRTEVAARKLTPYVYDGDEHLIPGVYGIREPDPERSRLADISRLDAIVVPGVAFDRTGGRLGYGGGFYDRFLAQLPRKPLLIGYAFSIQVVEQVPLEEHDYSLDYLVTDETVYGPFSGKSL
ncbi:5-formyltetrahydrofolate cyclo-ligase [Brevibacillus migulae]|uniref:5-formyltetrahydrofolate cyclo-ligase n=1 Tax=Brevibacillus migulae TaxID=1644114 RepID=UPI00106E491E|nr:5-formyltetrahydrofolate cyclo-ligase [Brevibacillus migulae]